MAHHRTTCTFCGAGCGLYLETADGHVAGAYPSMSHPSNEGRICVRGWHVHEIASSPDRLEAPLLRKADGALVEVGWDEALGFVASRLADIKAQHGPEAIALLASPRCSNEETYLLQKLARAVLGTNNVGHGGGVYRHNSIDVLLDALGVPAATNALAELDASDVIVVDGVDLARELPTVAGRVIRAHLAGARLIVVGERRHRLVAHADAFLQLRPGTEALLYGAMAKVIVDRGLVNQAFVKARCGGYDDFLATVRRCDLLGAAERCGVPAQVIEETALAYARARAAAVLWSTAQRRPPEAVQGIVNLALLTGQLGREGAGLYPLAEHNNLQGVCDMGLLPDRLPGYRPVASAAARAEVEARWGRPLPARPGLPAARILSDRGGGAVRALWLCRYDPVSTARLGDAAAALQACDLVVVQHLFATETAHLAHAVLPTTAFGEERVTFTSTERRIQIAEQAIAPPACILPAWEQIAEVARRLGADWSYPSSAAVMDEIAEVVPFYSGAQYDNLAREHGRQWPCTRDRPLGTRTLLADGPPGALRFAAVDAAPLGPSAAPDPEFPLTLVFGHSNYYWNQNVLIQHSETLRREYRILLLDYPDGFVELNPDDAKALGVRDGERIRLCGAAGAAVAAARVTPEVRRGAVFVPYFVRQVEQRVLGAGQGETATVPVRVEREVSP